MMKKMIINRLLSCIFKKEAVSGERDLSVEEIAEYHDLVRHPDMPGVLDDFFRFLGRYEFEHPGQDHIDSYNACRRAHPEWWYESQEADQ